MTRENWFVRVAAVWALLSLFLGGCLQILDVREFTSDGGRPDAGEMREGGVDAHDAHRDTSTPIRGDASPLSRCTVGGQSFEAGAPNPGSSCEVCEPSQSQTSWSFVSDGTSCGEAGICRQGECASGCEVQGVFYDPMQSQPGNPCQTCQPGTATHAFTPAPSGSSCGNGQVCNAGQCGTECEIDASVVASGARNPNNPCLVCQPGLTTSSWSGLEDGTICGDGGLICVGEQCAAECFIGGQALFPGATDPANLCTACNPRQSTSAFTPVANGTPGSCAGGQQCVSGACAAACVIDGGVYDASSREPGDRCRTCAPATSLSEWTSLANGTKCGDGGLYCSSGACDTGCLIAGTLYAPLAANPSNACQLCEVATAPTAWTNAASGTACELGTATGTCNGAGACIVTVTIKASGSWVVPSGISSITITAYGAEGGAGTSASGGNGASVMATLAVTAGSTLTLTLGGAGTKGASGGAGGSGGGGAGKSGGGGGGGLTMVSSSAGTLVVASGGGGGGGGASGGAGGAGASSGASGANASPGAAGGGGATMTAGGSGGAAATNGANGSPGTMDTGGAGGSGGAGAGGAGGGGGGGGGGYFGGGGGGSGASGGGGGGGSSFVSMSGTLAVITSGGASATVNAGSGYVVIEY